MLKKILIIIIFTSTLKSSDIYQKEEVHMNSELLEKLAATGMPNVVNKIICNKANGISNYGIYKIIDIEISYGYGGKRTIFSFTNNNHRNLYIDISSANNFNVESFVREFYNVDAKAFKQRQDILNTLEKLNFKTKDICDFDATEDYKYIIFGFKNNKVVIFKKNYSGNYETIKSTSWTSKTLDFTKRQLQKLNCCSCRKKINKDSSKNI